MFGCLRLSRLREWQSVKTLFDKVYEMEKTVTKSINNIYTLSENEGDRTATAMLDWFVGEQLQEESEARFVLKRLRLADSSPAALILLDQQFLDGTLLANVKQEELLTLQALMVVRPFDFVHDLISATH